MNRAILIVICDFIVSAMLSLFTGSSAATSADGTRGAALDNRTAVIVLNELRREQAELVKQRQALLEEQFTRGFTGDRQRRLAELTDRLAEASARADMLERKTASTKKDTGELTPEHLQRQLEKEVSSRYRLHLRKEEAERELAVLRKRNLEDAQKLQALRDENAARGGQLELLKKQQAEKERQLIEAGSALAKSRETIAARSAEIDFSGIIPVSFLSKSHAEGADGFNSH